MNIKSQLSKINFRLGRNPRIEQRNDYRLFIPNPYKTVLLISADFELAWGPRYAKKTINPLTKALELARQERKNIPEILSLAELFNIPITWATVGHLFLTECSCHRKNKHPEIPKIPPYEGPFWDFQKDDWFEFDPCTDYRRNPEWYAPDLIKKITGSRVDHEIGCHTFSHIDCRDGICPPNLIKAELEACNKNAAQWGLTLRSFVHPGHTIGNLEALKTAGFTSFRTDYQNTLGYPKNHGNGLWEFQQTAECYFRKGWSAPYHAKRYIEIIKRAMQSHTVCVLWFHPSFDPRVVKEVWPSVFQFIDQNKHDIWVTTHGKYADFLNMIQN